jgi:hypothetical protein
MAQQPSPDDQFRALLAAWLALYIDAEQRLLGGISGILRFTKPDMLSQLLARIKMKALTQQVVRELLAGDRYYATPTVQKAIEAGRYSGGSEVAKVSKDLEVAPKPFDFSIPHGIRSAQAIRDDLVSSLDDVKRRITRLPDDVYKIISPAASAGQALGIGYTPAQAQAYAWRNYVRQGITGFTDKAGRNWSLSAYVEMSVRTATQRAYNDAHLQVMRAAGINYFTVSDDGHPCPLCFPWQNRILTDGFDTDGSLIADATIAEATEAGLFHPNCKHILTAVIPGVTVLPEPREWSEQDALDYKNTQKQRRLELEIRKAKKSLEYAIAPSAQQDARLDIRHAQSNLRSFIDQTGFLRQSRREQVDLANDHLKLPA